MKLFASVTCALSLVACAENSDDPNGPGGSNETTAREFTLRIENVAPWSVLKASAQRMKTTGIEGLAGPGEAFEIRFSAAPGQVVSFASMLHESNDWFFAPDPEGIPLYVDGAPLSGDITSRVRLWDAGTEADQEPSVGAACGNRQTTRDAGTPDPETRVRPVADTVTLANGASYARPAINAMIRVTLTPGIDQQFTLRIENLSTTTTLQTSTGTRAITITPAVWALHRNPGVMFDAGVRLRGNGLELLVEAGQPDPVLTTLRFQRGIAASLSRGLFVVHRIEGPLFTPGAPDYGNGLERLAEDGNELPMLDAMFSDPNIMLAGAIDTPVDGAGPAALQPGDAFEVNFRGEPGDALSFATQFGAANDWFFAAQPAGIPLFLSDIPRWGDITSEIRLYDLGTEIDEELDVGPSTAPHQLAPDTGRADRDAVVRQVTLDRYDVPESRHLRVTLTPHDMITQ